MLIQLLNSHPLQNLVPGRAGSFCLTRLPPATESRTTALPHGGRGITNTMPEGRGSTPQNTKRYSPWESQQSNLVNH